MLRAAVALTAVDAVHDAGSAAAIVTFDTNPDVRGDGSVKWGGPRQLYLEGSPRGRFVWLYGDNASVWAAANPR